jgi:hypothetical protein
MKVLKVVGKLGLSRGKNGNRTSSITGNGLFTKEGRSIGRRKKQRTQTEGRNASHGLNLNAAAVDDAIRT